MVFLNLRLLCICRVLRWFDTTGRPQLSEHRYHVDGFSSAPPEVVFDVLVDGPGWADWAPGLKAASYECEGEPAPHGVGAIRRFGAGVGRVAGAGGGLRASRVLLLRVALGPAALARLPGRGAPHPRGLPASAPPSTGPARSRVGCPAWAPSSTAWWPGSPRAWCRSRSGEPEHAPAAEGPGQRHAIAEAMRAEARSSAALSTAVTGAPPVTTTRPSTSTVRTSAAVAEAITVSTQGGRRGCQCGPEVSSTTRSRLTRPECAHQSPSQEAGSGEGSGPAGQASWPPSLRARPMALSVISMRESRSAMAWRLSPLVRPRARASSTLARPSLK